MSHTHVTRRLIAGNAAATIVASSLSLGAQVLLQATEEKETYAVAVWGNALAGAISILMLGGQDLALARNLANLGAGSVRWRPRVWRHFIALAPFGAVGTWALCHALEVPQEWTAATVAMYLRQNAQSYAVQALNGAFRHVAATFVVRGNWICLAGIWMVAHAIPGYSTSLPMLIVAASVASSVICWAAVRHLPQGSQDLPGSHGRLGWSLYLVACTDTLLLSADRLLMPLVLDHDQFAGYAVLLTVSIGFDLMAIAVCQVLNSVYAQRMQAGPPWATTARMAVVGLGTLAAFIVFAMPVTHLIHGDRFEDAGLFVWPVACIGCVKVAGAPLLAWYRATAKPDALLATGIASLVASALAVSWGFGLACAGTPLWLPLGIVMALVLRPIICVTWARRSKRHSFVDLARRQS